MYSCCLALLFGKKKTECASRASCLPQVPKRRQVSSTTTCTTHRRQAIGMRLWSTRTNRHGRQARAAAGASCPRVAPVVVALVAAAREAMTQAHEPVHALPMGPPRVRTASASPTRISDPFVRNISRAIAVVATSAPTTRTKCTSVGGA